MGFEGEEIGGSHSGDDATDHRQGLYRYRVGPKDLESDRPPRPGRRAFQASIVSGSHPRTSPIIASGSGSAYRLSVGARTPIRSATSVRDR